MSDGTIDEHMTPLPKTVGAEQTLSYAEALMEEGGFRHLPVLHGGRLAGIVSARDLALASRLKDVDPATTTIEEVMTPESYTVMPDTPVAEVVRQMAEHGYGSALIVSGTKVAGIFTATDAVRLLAEKLA